MTILNFTIAAGETKMFHRAGAYVEVIDALGALDFELEGPDGQQGEDFSGALSGFFVTGAFRSFSVRNVEAYAQSVRIVVAGSAAGSRRLSGNVRVVDQSADKTRAGLQFYGSNTQPAQAGLVSVTGLWANAKEVAVRALVLQSDTAGYIRIGSADALGTVYGVNNTMGNKLIGGAGSTCRRFVGTTAAVLPAAGEATNYATLARYYVQPNVPYVVEFKEPIIISGTKAILISGESLARMVDVVIACEEL